ncbi:hypothetical protein [Actinokineospora sp. NPDC004072]
MLDDDTGRRTHVPIRSEDRPPRSRSSTQPPSDAVRELILDHRQRHPQWDANRLATHFRKIHGRHDISLAAIEVVLGQTRYAPRPGERQGSSGEF